MQMVLSQVFNGSAEVESAAQYPNVRIVNFAQQSSKHPQDDIKAWKAIRICLLIAVICLRSMLI